MAFTTALSPLPTSKLASASAPFSFIPLSTSLSSLENSTSNETNAYLQSVVSPNWNLNLDIYADSSSANIVSGISVNFPNITTDPQWTLYALYFPYLTQKLEEAGVPDNGSCAEILGGYGMGSCYYDLQLAGSAAISLFENGGRSGWASISLPANCSSVYGNTTDAQLLTFVTQDPELNKPFLYLSEPISSSNASVAKTDAQERIWPVFLWEQPIERIASEHLAGFSTMRCVQASNSSNASTTSTISSTATQTTATSTNTDVPAATTSAKSVAWRLTAGMRLFLPIIIVSSTVFL